MAQTSEYEVVGTLHHNGEVYRPGDTVDLTDDEAAPLLEATPPAIQEPGAEGEPSPTPATTTAENPLAPRTIAEIEAILPEVDDRERLEEAAAHEASHQDRTGAMDAVRARLEDLAEDEG